MINSINKQTKDSGGFREVLHVAFPLILASSGIAIRIFTDRTMLAQYSSDAIAAAVPAGLTCFTLMCFFMGTAGYASTFVAQYVGSKQYHKVGPAVWQAIIIALFGGITTTLIVFTIAEPLFDSFSRPESVRLLEKIYFKGLGVGAIFHILSATLATFWNGRGSTRFIMVIELASASINIILNYALIFGHFGFPELGITGAAYATNIAAGFSCICYAIVFLSKQNRIKYNTYPKTKLDLPLLKRLLKFGSPNGVQFLLDLAAFNTFVFVISTKGTIIQEANTIAMTWNALAFIPIIGLGITVNILVGQSIGKNDIPHAERAVKSARNIALLYFSILGIFFVFAPSILLLPFVRENASNQKETLELAAIFLKYIAVFLCFDALFIVYQSAIKGAGDTKFSMIIGVLMAWGLLAMPCALLYYYDVGVFWLWRVLVAYIITAGTVFYIRYKGGKWKTMRVIEPS